MASLQELSIAINSLFQDIKDPMTLGLNKNNFFNTYKNTSFRLSNATELEFNANPILQFEDSNAVLAFLKKEKILAERYSDYSNQNEIEDLLQEAEKTVALDNFYLNYSIEINDEEVLVLFTTNSLLFKYEVIG